jgi:uncharacterized delta-60 repeat protein
MSTRPDSRQIKQVQALGNLGVVANSGQDQVNLGVDAEFDYPLRPKAAFPTPDDRLYFSDSLVSDSDGGSSVVALLNKQVFDSLSGLYIDFQDQSVSSAPDFDIQWPVSNIVGRFRRAALALTTAGQIAVVFGNEALTQGALEDPGTLYPRGSQPLGYVDLECTNVAGYFKTAGSATDVIENQGIYRLATGSGSGQESAETFAIANNQASPTDVTGFVVDSAEAKQFVAEVSLERRYQGTIDGTEDANFSAGIGGPTNGANNDVFGISYVSSVQRLFIGGQFTSFNATAVNRITAVDNQGVIDSAIQSNLGTGFNSIVMPVVAQPDGKVLVGGEFTSFNTNGRNRLVRLNSDGTEDTAFYTNLGTGFNGIVWAISVQDDGKILVGGDFTELNSFPRGGLVRLNTDGTEDTAFYTNLTSTGDGSGFSAAPPVLGLAIQSDGKIVCVGVFSTLNGAARARMTRLNADGTEDTAFYTNLGTAVGAGIALCVAVDSSDKIFVGGSFTQFNSNTRNYLVRLNSDGTEDTAFYTNLGTAFNGDVNSVSIQSDDKAVVGGSFTQFNSNTRNYLVRLNSDGTEDTAFYTNFGGAGAFVAITHIQSDGKIAIGGNFATVDGLDRRRIHRIGSDSSELLESFSLRGYYSDLASQWLVGEGPGFGSDAGVDFTMTSGGQLQYTSTNVPGIELEARMQYLIRRL